MIKRFVSTLLVVTAFATVCVADDESALRHMKTVLWPKAYLTQDLELLDELLHDSFELIDADGSRARKQDELEFIRNNKWNPGNFKYVIDRLDIYDDAFAIVSGTGITDTYTYSSSNVLIKEDDQWRAIASHVSGYENTEGSE